jgi:hypothetical protein
VRKTPKNHTQALIIIHLSSLDVYTNELGQARGYDMADGLAGKAEQHCGPVIIIDQLWELRGRDSDPRASVYESIQKIPDERLVLIRHDEDDGPTAWNNLFNELVLVLNELGVDSIKIGGFWYDPDNSTGCAWYVGQQLSDSFDVMYDRHILGSYADIGGPDEENWDD